MLVLTVLLAGSCLSKGHDREGEAMFVTLGDTGIVGDFSLRLAGVRDPADTPARTGLPIDTPGYRIVSFEIFMRNESATSRRFTFLDLRVVDRDGRSFSYEIVPGELIAKNEFGAGQQVDAVIYVGVPAGRDPTTVLFTPGAKSSEIPGAAFSLSD
jgi:hypothetical protein